MIEYLTHERLNHKFKNNFDLTNYAIDYAKKSILEQNPKSLNLVLKELEELPDVETEDLDKIYA